jgi:hypothetical protein
MGPPEEEGVDGVVVVATGGVVVVATGGVVVVATGGVVVVVAPPPPPPPFPPPPPPGATVVPLDVGLIGDWRSSPNLINWLRADSDAKTFA